MKYLLSTLAALVFHSTAAFAEYSVVVGHGIRVGGVRELGDDWVTGYIWLVNAKQTVSGPSVKGRIRIVAASHAQPTDAYIKSVQLFVLSPIGNSQLGSKDEPQFSLIASSPLYEERRYCVPFRPSEITTPIEDSAVEYDEDMTIASARNLFSRPSSKEARQQPQARRGKAAHRRPIVMRRNK